MDIKLSCFSFDVDCSPDVLVGRLSVELSLSSITLVCSDVSDSVGSPEVELLVSPLVDVCSDMSADVGRPVSPLPSVGSLFLQDLLWEPVAPQLPVVDDRRATLCLGGGWLGRARSSRNGRLSISVHSGLDVPSGIRRTVTRTT